MRVQSLQGPGYRSLPSSRCDDAHGIRSHEVFLIQSADEYHLPRLADVFARCLLIDDFREESFLRLLEAFKSIKDILLDLLSDLRLILRD